MELIRIKTLKHLEVFKKEWNKILDESNNDNPLIRYTFIYNWWRLLENKEQVEVYAVKEHNRIIAFFPFQVKKMGLTYVIHFIGKNELAYMDFIVKKVDLKRVIMFTMDELIKRKKSIVFYLRGLLESSDTIDSLSEYLIARNLKVRSYRLDLPFFDLENMLKLDRSLGYELSNLEKYFEVENTRIIIFSSNMIKAKMYRNFLWVKEWGLSKRSPKSNSENMYTKTD